MFYTLKIAVLLRGNNFMKKNAITKSSILIQKELEFKKCQKKKEKLLININTLKKTLADNQSTIDRMMKDRINTMSRMSDLGRLAKDIRQVVKNLFKKINRTQKAEINQFLEQTGLQNIENAVKDMFEYSQFGTAENFESGHLKDEEQFTDEFNRQRQQAMFEQFAVKVDDTERANIRKLFIKLANRFHPDKAENEPERLVFHHIMQSINMAYEANDLSELLVIQDRYQAYQTVDDSATYDIMPLVDVLDSNLLKIQHEIDLLDSQLKRLQKELKNVKQSDLGLLLKEDKKGHDTSGDLSQTSLYMSEMLTEMQKVLAQWLETGKKPMSFNEFMDGSHAIIQKGIALNMFSTPYDDDDDDDEMTDEEYMAFVKAIHSAHRKNNRRRR